MKFNCLIRRDTLKNWVDYNLVISFVIRPDGSIGGWKKNPTEEDVEKLKTYAIAAGKDYRVGWYDGTGIAVWEQVKEKKVVVGEEV